MPKFCPLASGSKGNCLYLESDQTKILIDAGISAKATERKLAQIGVQIDEIDAVLVSHDHGDHIHGLRVLAYKKGLPVLANHETAKGIVNTFHDCPRLKIFSTGEPFVFADLEIHPFSVPHDTIDPVAFTIKTKEKKLGLCTDLGFITSQVRNKLQECDYLLLEANHEPSMVHACPRPQVYKQRVLSRSGHLSNQACGELLCDVAHEGLQHVHLAHLSSECNSPEKALGIIGDILEKRGIALDMCIAPQDKISKAVEF